LASFSVKSCSLNSLFSQNNQNKYNNISTKAAGKKLMAGNPFFLSLAANMPANGYKEV